MPVIGPKALLRNSGVLLAPSSISEEEIDIRSRRAQSILLQAFAPQSGDKVGIYASMAGEVGTGLIAKTVRECGGLVYYPRITIGGEMAFYPAGPESKMIRGLFGIPVPEGNKESDRRVDGFDLVVVPGLAFDRRGYRLGRGGGYYDRFLSRPVSSKVVGLAFSWQVVHELPIDPWDVPVGAVVTESGVIRVSVPIEDTRACK